MYFEHAFRSRTVPRAEYRRDHETPILGDTDVGRVRARADRKSSSDGLGASLGLESIDGVHDWVIPSARQASGGSLEGCQRRQAGDLERAAPEGAGISVSPEPRPPVRYRCCAQGAADFASVEETPANHLSIHGTRTTMIRACLVPLLAASLWCATRTVAEPPSISSPRQPSRAAIGMDTLRDIATFRWLRGPSRQHEAALAQIEELGAEHEVEHDERGRPFLVVTWNGGDEGLDQLRALDDLRWLDLSRTNVTDRGLAELAELKRLRVLKLQQTRVTDAGLAYLGDLTELQGLALHDTKVSPKGLEHLRPLTNLKILNLCWTRAGDLGLEAISGCSKLEELYLFDAKVTDKGAVHLARLRNLRALKLSYNDITDEGLANLQGLPNLEALWLDFTQTGDAGLAHLQTLPRLRGLYLGESQVTDAGLGHLAGIRTLEILDLTNLPITDAGLKRIQRCAGLQMLSLEGTAAGPNGMTSIGKLKTLTQLNLGSTDRRRPGRRGAGEARRTDGAEPVANPYHRRRAAAYQSLAQA